MIPRVGEPVRNTVRYTKRHGVYAILERDGRVLLTHQDRPDPQFQIPGGGIDPGESPFAALHREVMEETGWKIAGLRRVGAFRRYTFLPEYDLWAEKICQVFHARPVRQMSAPTELAHTPVWTTPELAVKLVENDGDRLFLSRGLR